MPGAGTTKQTNHVKVPVVPQQRPRQSADSMASYGYGGRGLKEAGSGNVPPSWAPLIELMPYLWPKGRPDLRFRVVISILLLILTPIVTVATPYFLGYAVDAFRPDPRTVAIIVPIAFIISYGVAWVMSQA